MTNGCSRDGRTAGRICLLFTAGKLAHVVMIVIREEGYLPFLLLPVPVCGGLKQGGVFGLEFLPQHVVASL